MVCVSKTLLCALVANSGLAVRQNLKVDQSGALATVVDQVSALIQAQHTSGTHSKALDSIRMLASATPAGTSGALNTALNDVIGEIEDTVDKVIKQSFEDTKTAIADSIVAIGTATGLAQSAKSSADTADNEWYGCIDEEKSMRVTYEDAVTTLQTATVAVVEPCANQKASKDFESNPNLAPKGLKDWSFDCNFGNGADWADACTGDFASYKSTVSNMLVALKNEADGATAIWNEHRLECEQTTAAMNQATTDMEEADTNWQGKRISCLTMHETRKTEMCDFGVAYMLKCSQVDDYNALIAEVEEIGTAHAHSEADRISEWETAHVTKCLLKMVVEGKDLDDTSAQACKDEVNYALDVVGDGVAAAAGVLDTKREEFETLTSTASFTCAESTITFQGMTWNVPQDVSPKSTEYTSEENLVGVNHEGDLSPFDFC